MEKGTLRKVGRMLRKYPMLQGKHSCGLQLWRKAIEDTLTEYETAGETQKTAILTRHYFDGASNEEMSSGACEKLMMPSIAYLNSFQKLHLLCPAARSTFS